MPLKLYCVVAREALRLMNGSRGKFGTQAGHAYLHAYWDAEARFPAAALAYRNSGYLAKITLAVETVDDLRRIEAAYRDRCGVALIEDAGKTVFRGPTVTCLGLGPFDGDAEAGELAALKPLS